ncbi:hypothetical protein KUTeg_014537 [Tegillarca granosa]|uniref:C2H2-type domain-containing protein n=1 Tax=Tegillarca granosa TaxID=220873 RepID=A0ABQ9EWZ8_TEGGR|nr:hypothetical protein KUTeg_014537 [Tegillarca granosa]
METISIKQEPVDDGYGQALTTYGCGGESREEYPGNKSSKPIGKSKLLKLLFSQDVPPSFDDDTCNSVTLSSANDKNGSSVRMKTVANQEYEKTTRNGSSIRIKTEVVDPEYEETTRSESSVKIKTEVVDPEYEGTTRVELVNMSASNGSHSKLFSLLSTAPDSNHRNQNTVGMPNYSHCNGASHVTPKSQLQDTAAKSSSLTSSNANLSESVGGQGHTGVESRDRGQVYTGGQNSVPNQGLVEPPVVHKPGENPTFWIYRCKQCFKTFRHAGTLKVHERAHSYDREEFKCNICGKVCSAAGYLAIHMRTHFPEKAKENEGIFTCTLCRDTFSERENLLIHLRMHSGEKLFKCEVCHTGFTRKTQLFIHMRIHTGEKPYRCEFCNKTFRQSNGLNLHLTTHTEDKPYRCEICNKGFGRKAHYDKHMRKHRGERPFVCTECGKGFTDKFNLTMHTKIHNKEKDHICGICNKGYNQASHLKNHMKFHTGELGYRCVYCYKTTEFKRELYTHFKGDHPDLYQDYVTKQKKKRYYEILNPRFQYDTSLNRKLEDEEDSDVDEMMESDYESEAESGGDNFQFDEDVKPVINDIHTEYER